MHEMQTKVTSVLSCACTMQKWLSGSRSCCGEVSWGQRTLCSLGGLDPFTARGRGSGEMLPIVLYVNTAVLTHLHSPDDTKFNAAITKLL